MATTLAKDADDTEAATPAACIEQVAESFSGPAGQQLVLDGITHDVSSG